MAWLRGAHSGPTRGELNGSQIRGQGAAPTRWRVDIDGDSDSDDEGPSKPRSQGNFSIDTSVDSKAGDDAARPLRSATDSVMGASDFDRLIEQSELEVSSQPTEPGEAGDEAPGAFNTLQLSAVSRNVDDAAIRRVFAQEMQIRRVSESRVLLHFHDDTSALEAYFAYLSSSHSIGTLSPYGEEDEQQLHGRKDHELHEDEAMMRMMTQRQRQRRRMHSANASDSGSGDETSRRRLSLPSRKNSGTSLAKISSALNMTKFHAPSSPASVVSDPWPSAADDDTPRIRRASTDFTVGKSDASKTPSMARRLISGALGVRTPRARAVESEASRSG